ncbi:MAG TPA: hypothetical protein VMZ90_08870 [Vicinamibacterales bacterium]|nr:hypothetical protein [Vicinamibacterales bacterium]
MAKTFPVRPPIVALILWAALMAVYNANGREIGGSDSQPAKMAARALALRGNLLLDDDIRRAPPLAERGSFARDLQGHYRSAYSPVGSLFGSVTALLMRAAGADLNAPRGANLIAKITASSLTAVAVCFVFLTLTRFSTTGVSLAVAIGLGLGTNYWALYSQTMGQHEVVAFGLGLMLLSWARPAGEIAKRHLWLGAFGLGLAVTARTQVGPLVGLLCLGLIVRVGWRRALGPIGLATAMLALLLVVQWRWFGHPLGGMVITERLHKDVHAVEGSLSREPWIGAAGLLVSPNRGLLVFSPIVLVALIDIGSSLRALPDYGLGWMYLGCAALYIGYSLYSVWWGGHAYGPRYLLDFAILLTPAAAVALSSVLRAGWMRGLAALLLVWSITVAGVGAFCADNWNTSPASVDLNHGRLWDWRDLQIRRAWVLGPSPQNFTLFNWTSWYPTGPPDVR